MKKPASWEAGLFRVLSPVGEENGSDDYDGFWT